MPEPIAVDWAGGSNRFDITSGTTGQQLMDAVLECLRLHEEPLFGLQYTDKKGYLSFLKKDKKIVKHDIQKGTALQFIAQYFPENVTEELRNATIQRIFWKQIRDAICNDDIYCPAELCVFFAALTLQIEKGSFDPGMHPRGSIDILALLPRRIISQFSLTAPQWEEKVVHVWETIRGLDPETAILDYLTVAQDLEQYGVTYFEVTNKRGTRLWLGVHSMGMDVYLYNNKVTPQVGFPWNEIRNISFSDKKFRIKLTSSAHDFKFFAPRYKINKRILALCVGNHMMFISRRQGMLGGDVEEDRGAVEAKIRRTKDLIGAIRRDIDTTRDESKDTAEDRLHRAQEEQGLDKFKTMKRAQGGDAQRRISMFNDLDSDV